MKQKSPKILIWDLEINLRNSGGPAGYLYNLREYLRHNNSRGNIVFLKDLLGIENNKTTLHSKYKKLINLIHKMDIFNIWPRINVIRRYLSLWEGSIKCEAINALNLNEFDIIHFHISPHIIRAQKLLNDYHGLTVLTTHSPEPLSYECVSEIKSDLSIIKRFLRHRMERLELNAWELADYLMFPVKEATEPYNISLRLKDYLSHNPQKTIFCPTSIIEKHIITDRTIFTSKLNIPEDAFVITYVGRHSEVKGYNELTKLGEEVLNKYPNVYFVIAGNYTQDQIVNHPRWIELGWINYGAELIASSDLFILPNKETYFDIVALEVLRSGTPIMMSLTGGNKHFMNIEANQGILFYNYGDIVNQISLIEKMLQTSIEERMKMRSANRHLFASHFTMEKFYARYLNLIQDIIE